MTDRDPIHVGSGEPMVLLHPFMMSQNVWKRVAPLIAETGRYEVFAPTMPGHNGGTPGPFFLGSGALADDVERHLAERAAHIGEQKVLAAIDPKAGPAVEHNDGEGREQSQQCEIVVAAPRAVGKTH